MLLHTYSSRLFVCKHTCVYVYTCVTSLTCRVYTTIILDLELLKLKLLGRGGSMMVPTTLSCPAFFDKVLRLDSSTKYLAADS